MLGKLIKYDLKSLNPILIFVHAFFLLAAFFIRIFISNRLFNKGFDTEDPYTMMSSILLITLFSLAMVLIAFLTELLIAARFYKNLFSGEGYLTLTLPVTPGQHLLSRTISGVLWGVIDMLLVFFAAYLAFATPYVKQVFGEEFSGMWAEFSSLSDTALPSPTTIVLFTLLFCITGVAASILSLYASAAIGQVLFGHRVIGAIAVYFVINTVFSFLTLIAMALTGNMNMLFYDPSAFQPVLHLKNSLILAEWVSLVSILALYFLTYYIMKKKINLD